MIRDFRSDGMDSSSRTLRQPNTGIISAPTFFDKSLGPKRDGPGSGAHHPGTGWDETGVARTNSCFAGSRRPSWTPCSGGAGRGRDQCCPGRSLRIVGLGF